MRHNEEYWQEKAHYWQWRHEHLLKSFQGVLVNSVELQKQNLEKDKVILALQERVKTLTQKQSTGAI